MNIETLKELGEQFLRLINNCETRQQMLEMFEELGFYKKTSSSEAFLNDEVGYVVKFPYLLSWGRGVIPKFAVTTFQADLPEKENGFFDPEAHAFMVQPLVDTTPEAIKTFKELTKGLTTKELGYDTCEWGANNIGMYMDKPVVYDW